jgi:tRNA-2-methylthio-N6-dimethylallyladenosine synthase
MTLIEKSELLFQIALFHDMITGFPTETEKDHQDTLSLMEYVKYNFGYMYSYSERPEHWQKNGR